MKEFLKKVIEKGGNVIVNIQRSNVTIGNDNDTSGFRFLEYPQNQQIEGTEVNKELGWDSQKEYDYKKGGSGPEFTGFFS